MAFLDTTFAEFISGKLCLQMFDHDGSDIVTNTLAYSITELITTPTGLHSGRLLPCLQMLVEDRSDVVTNTLAYNNAELIRVFLRYYPYRAQLSRPCKC